MDEIEQMVDTGYSEMAVKNNSFNAELIAYLYAKQLTNNDNIPTPRWQVGEKTIDSDVVDKLAQIRKAFQGLKVKDFGESELSDHQILKQAEIDVFLETDDKVYCIETTHHKGGYHPCDKSERTPLDFFAQKVVRDAICGWAFQTEKGKKPVHVLFMTTRFRPRDEKVSEDGRSVATMVDGLNKCLRSEIAPTAQLQVITGKDYLNVLKSLTCRTNVIQLSTRAIIEAHLHWVEDELEHTSKETNC